MSIEEQIMSKDKYPYIFSSQMEANIFRNTRGFENWGIFSDIPQF